MRSKATLRQGALAAVFVGVSLFLAGIAGGAAIAGTASSSHGFYTIGGTQYRNFATVNTGTGAANAQTYTDRYSGGTPAGWAGSQGRLFTSGGSLTRTGSWQYNTSGSGAVSNTGNHYASGSWYSYGLSQGWGGSSYTTFYTYQSPNQSS